MKRRTTDLIWLAGSLLLLSAVACATSGEGSEHRSGPITRAELDSVDAFTVDEALSLLRPVWLSQFVGACYEEEDMNRQAISRLPLSQILEIRRISASEATRLCSIGFTAGAAPGYYLHIRRRQ